MERHEGKAEGKERLKSREGKKKGERKNIRFKPGNRYRRKTALKGQCTLSECIQLYFR